MFDKYLIIFYIKEFGHYPIENGELVKALFFFQKVK